MMRLHNNNVDNSNDFTSIDNQTWTKTQWAERGSFCNDLPDVIDLLLHYKDLLEA